MVIDPTVVASAAPRVLVVDDDARLRGLVERYLREQGLDVVVAEDVRSAEQQLQRFHVDAIVLDVMMPGEDGLSFCRRLRAQDEHVAIIMLTARGDDVDRIVGLEIGADDYLPKPGNPRELLARLRAVLRRRAATTAAAPRPEVGVQQFGRCTLDHARRILVRDGVEQRLTSGEFALLSVLLRHAGQPLSRDRLMSLAHGRDHEPFERSIDVTVSRLRRMIEDDPKHPRHLQTVWGQGYVFVAD
ncbi:MAG: two-component system response regulator OmpR [Xanthomonadales bacterium]|nr:two-component system response regulator OmpR [Xanthomonadales bacterium]